MSDILIKNGQVLQIDADGTVRLHSGFDVLIEGTRISGVRPTGQTDPEGFRDVIDATGMVVMPGLINTHAHTPMALFRGLAEDVPLERWFNEFMWPLENNLQPDDVFWGMQLGLAEMIRGGITTVVDHYFYQDQAAQAVDAAGTRAVLGWTSFGTDGDAGVQRGADFVQQWHGAAGGRIMAMMAPHAPYTCDDDHLRASASAARALGVGVHIHAAETMDQTRASLEKRGLTPVQVLAETGVLDVGALIAHGIGLEEHDIALLADSGARVATAPKTYMKLHMGRTPIPALRAAGVPVGLATDGPVSNSTLDLWESMRLMALLEKSGASAEALPIAEVLHIATRSSAAAIGMAHELGAIEIGYLADIILVDVSGLHHQPLHSVTASLVYNTMAADVMTVIVNGQVIMRDRGLLTLDEREIVLQAGRSMARLAQRHPDKRIQVYNP